MKAFNGKILTLCSQSVNASNQKLKSNVYNNFCSKKMPLANVIR